MEVYHAAGAPPVAPRVRHQKNHKVLDGTFLSRFYRNAGDLKYAVGFSTSLTRIPSWPEGAIPAHLEDFRSLGRPRVGFHCLAGSAQPLAGSAQRLLGTRGGYTAPSGLFLPPRAHLRRARRARGRAPATLPAGAVHRLAPFVQFCFISRHFPSSPFIPLRSPSIPRWFP